MFVIATAVIQALAQFGQLFADDTRFDFLLSTADYSFDANDPEPDAPSEYVEDLMTLVNDAQGRQIHTLTFQDIYFYWIKSETEILALIRSIIEGTYTPPADWMSEEDEDPAGHEVPDDDSDMPLPED